MNTGLEAELEAAHAIVSRQYEVITCWRTMFIPNELQFIPLPAEMWEIIRSSNDYHKLIPLGPPTLFSISSDNDVVELMAYQAAADGRVYMLAPIKSRSVSSR